MSSLQMPQKKYRPNSLCSCMRCPSVHAGFCLRTALDCFFSFIMHPRFPRTSTSRLQSKLNRVKIALQCTYGQLGRFLACLDCLRQQKSALARPASMHQQSRMIHADSCKSSIRTSFGTSAWGTSPPILRYSAIAGAGVMAVSVPCPPVPIAHSESSRESSHINCNISLFQHPKNLTSYINFWLLRSSKSTGSTNRPLYTSSARRVMATQSTDKISNFSLNARSRHCLVPCYLHLVVQPASATISHSGFIHHGHPSSTSPSRPFDLRMDAISS